MDREEDKYFEEQDDLLEQYMKQINSELKQNNIALTIQPNKLETFSIQPISNTNPNSEILEFNDDIQIPTKKKHIMQVDEEEDDEKDHPKGIAPLPLFDHSQCYYENVRVNFYNEHPNIANMPPKIINEIMEAHSIKVYGSNSPRLFTSFNELIIDKPLLNVIKEQKFVSPTPIQMQGLPAVLSGRDVIGIAKTGSGKTLVYLIPMILHILDQKLLGPKEGPIALIIAPTRELSQQIYDETIKYTKPYKLNVVGVWSEENKTKMWKDVMQGVEVIIGTPGKLIDMHRQKAFSLQKRCTFIVLDEADTMFSMGFEYQMRSLVAQARPNRQMLMFSATYKVNVQKLSEDCLKDPIKIIIGKLGSVYLLLVK